MFFFLLFVFFQIFEVGGLVIMHEGSIKIWLEVRRGIRKKTDSPYNLVTCWDLFFKYGEF